MSESLTRSKPPLPDPQLETAQALHGEALRMSALVANLLDMARLQSGEVKLNLEWQVLEEAVGTALRLSAASLVGHRVATRIPADFPLLRFDAVLLERVLCNLLENAAKYTPCGSCIDISAALCGTWASLTIADDGPGVAPGREEEMFEKFTRGEREAARSGVGLGLAICRAIVEAHGGRIGYAASALGGAAFIITLPLGQPPSTPELEMDTRTTL